MVLENGTIESKIFAKKKENESFGQSRSANEERLLKDITLAYEYFCRPRILMMQMYFIGLIIAVIYK